MSNVAIFCAYNTGNKNKCYFVMVIEIQILEWRKVEKMNQKVEQLAIE